MNKMKRLQMREHTRRAVSDVCGVLMAEYGIVLTFHQVQRMAECIDREMMRFGDCAKSATPDQWNQIKAETVEVIE